ncbi:MAG: redox-regulated ATPase YchF, partial [bacterium]|nr:redox-regulated ATPase YchF [bacterium]
MKVGIIGLEYAGKKSLFTLLTGKQESNISPAKEEIGTVNVPDERVDNLAEFYKTNKKIYSQIEFHLVPSIKKDSQETNKALVEAKEMDMFGLVIRQFKEENVYHPYETIDIIRDYETIKHEMIFADLFLVESRLERIEKQIHSKKEDILLKEKDLLLHLKESLEKGT